MEIDTSVVGLTYTNNQKLWILSFDFALVTLLAVLIVVKVTIVKFSKHTSFNKLTLLPYYFALAYALLTMTQYCFQSQSMGDKDKFFAIKNQVNNNRVCCINTAFAIQIFEWLNTWMIMNFQKNYDITDVVIEKRKF